MRETTRPRAKTCPSCGTTMRRPSGGRAAGPPRRRRRPSWSVRPCRPDRRPHHRRDPGQEGAPMRFSELIRGIAEPGPGSRRDLDPEVTGVTHDSRRVVPGDLYVALPGQRFDGWDFAAAAVAAGAVAVAGAAPREPAVVGPGVPWALVADPRAGLAALAARAHGHPDRELVMAGVTGTNGKTTVTLLIAAMLD